MSNNNNPPSRRGIVPAEERPEILNQQNPNQPENDIGVIVGAVGGGGAGVRLRDENSLSFRHFLQPQSDLVPQPTPHSRGGRGNRGGVDLVEATMALPDFVQDHLVLESAAAASAVEPSQDMSPSRPHPHSAALDLSALNEILLPDLGSSHQRNPHQRNSTRRSDHASNDCPISAVDIPGGGSALPDFLSDGPMQLNQSSGGSGSGGDLSNSSAEAIPSSGNRNRTPNSSSNNNIFPEEPVRGPSFESKESLRLQIDRLRSELAEKNRKIHQLETDLSSQRNISTSMESSLRVAERNLSGAVKRATDAEAQLQNNHAININGHGGLSPSENYESLDSGSIANIARSSESLIGQLLQNMQELKKIADDQGSRPDEKKRNNSSSEEAKPSRSSR